VRIPAELPKGLHSLRHTLASVMLAKVLSFRSFPRCSDTSHPNPPASTSIPISKDSETALSTPRRYFPMERGKGTFAMWCRLHRGETRHRMPFRKGSTGAPSHRRSAEGHRPGSPLSFRRASGPMDREDSMENEGNRNQRTSVLRGLGVFMTRMGYDAVAVPQRLVPRADYAYTPYIFSERELGLLLDMVDRLCQSGISSHSDLVLPWCSVSSSGAEHGSPDSADREEGRRSPRWNAAAAQHEKRQRAHHSHGWISYTECRAYAAKNPLTRGFSSSEWFSPTAKVRLTTREVSMPSTEKRFTWRGSPMEAEARAAPP